MEAYVQEALAQKYVVRSMSPESARFFLVEMKGGGPCIDYRGLNLISIK